MAKAPTLEAKVFKSHARAVVHLRAQRIRHRLGLIFGSGISNDLSFPGWPDLVDRIASHAKVDATALIEKCKDDEAGAEAHTRTHASITQILFSEFWRKQIIAGGLREPLTFLEEQKIRSDWLVLIHRELYKDCSEEERAKKLSKHPFLQDFRSIIKTSPLTVTYNFDDSLEKLLMLAREGDEVSKTRGYEVTDRPDQQFQNDSAIIYHPNGYLPNRFSDGSSARVVFADDAFQDQLISAATGRYVHLSNHLFRNTCLLVGLSLDDMTLKSLLRQNAVNNPGNIHYYIHYVKNASKLGSDVKRGIFSSNFESYGLYTLFLSKKEIAALARLISLEETNFRLNYEESCLKYVYYIVGSVGAGKSTAAANFHNLRTYDEWIDERKEALARPESEVEEEAPEIDAWIREQFRKKNYALTQSSEGIHLVDRCPLDPLTFGKTERLKEKAKNLVRVITNNGARKVESGHIIFLECSLEQVKLRNSFKHKYWSDEAYEDLLERIEKLYGSMPEVTRICTRGRNAQAVAHEIAKAIFLGNYRPVDLQAKLQGAAQEAGK